MDTIALLLWLKLLHIGGAFLFAAGHGVSMAVAARAPRPESVPRELVVPSHVFAGACYLTSHMGTLVSRIGRSHPVRVITPTLDAPVLEVLARNNAARPG